MARDFTLTPSQALSIIAAMDPDGMGRITCAHVVDMAYAALLKAPVSHRTADWLREHVPTVIALYEKAANAPSGEGLESVNFA